MERYTNPMDYTADDIEIIARTIWGEARGEIKLAQVGVAWVIRNRVENPRWWGHSIHDVCTKPFQFSCWLPSDPNSSKCHAVRLDDPTLQECAAVAIAVLDGMTPDPTGGADSYHDTSISPPAWTGAATRTAQLGALVYYRVELTKRCGRPQGGVATPVQEPPPPSPLDIPSAPEPWAKDTGENGPGSRG